MSGKVSDLPIRYKRAVFTQKKLDRINFRSGNGGRVLRNPPGVTHCWSRSKVNSDKLLCVNMALVDYKLRQHFIQDKVSNLHLILTTRHIIIMK